MTRWCTNRRNTSVLSTGPTSPQQRSRSGRAASILSFITADASPQIQLVIARFHVRGENPSVRIMASPNDVPMAEGDVDIHKPFTVQENIQQLNEIDKSIVQLMNHVAKSLNAVSVTSNGDDSRKTELNPDAQKEALHTSADDFLDTLHSVDVRMKRQIMALEETGIVDLSGAPKQDRGNTIGKASLKPNGMGNVGNLDVGWLNSRGSKVERDMEAELWTKAREFLQNEGDKFEKN